MLLDRIEIDAHGPLTHVELGPLSEHLNVVWAPDGSGKTAVSRFIRDALVDREYPLGMFTSSTGRVVLADRHGRVHCYREKDGSAAGRRRVEFESRGDFRGHFDHLEHSWIAAGVARSSDARLAFASMEQREQIVDSVITDTSAGSVARVVSACVRCGIDMSAAHGSARFPDDAIDADYRGRFNSYGNQAYQRHQELRRELAEVEARLARHSVREADHDSLIARREKLSLRLAQPRHEAPVDSAGHHRQLEQRSSELQHRARDLRTRQSELRRRIADLELDIANCDSGSVAPGATVRGQEEYPALCRDRDVALHDLDRLTTSLDACLSEAADVGRTLRASSINRVGEPVMERGRSDQAALAAEIRQIDDFLASLSHVRWLRTRRDQLIKQIGPEPSEARATSPLAEAASRWLIRLSAGRLRRIDWSTMKFERDPSSYHRDLHAPAGVRINGREETHCALADRILSSIAVRMAASDLLARTGRHVPLVVEIPREAWTASHHNTGPSYAYREPVDHLRSIHPVAVALRDFANAGRQVLVLTSSRGLSRQLSIVGARSFEIHSHRVVHAQRPMWRSQYQGESYVGPHPHTYGSTDAEDARSSQELQLEKNEADVNRDLDVAWRESQAYSETGCPQTPGAQTPGAQTPGESSERTDWARDGLAFRDGYYYADRYSTDSPSINLPSGEASQRNPTSLLSGRANATPASPFYLTVDSPIDQAPSVDAVTAARLRGLNVTHITHLMQRDPNRLSDALGLASVDAATIRRWQAESRLACRVPNVRGFDARILVGCGITTPGQLAEMHPTELLHEVQDFLTTERGRQVMQCGTSQELSRIMTWIATANQSSRASIAPPATQTERRRRSIPQRSDRRDVTASTTNSEGLTDRELRFHLHRNDPIVDAPSIGPKMAQRLEAIGTRTVDDLLTSDPETLAADLAHDRVDADTIVRWQHQSELVCRVPMLRGHDSQLLVAAEVTTPEELAESDARDLFALIDTISRSNEGKRILRGGVPPDLAEVKDWIRWARNPRSLRAA